MNGTTTKTMRELLARWAEAEPGRCKLVENDYFKISLDADNWHLVYPDSLTSQDLMWIQWAVQQAIVARGWAFELKYNPDCPDPNNPFDATVDSNTSGGWGFGNDGFAAPLLEAYLHTLEGSK